MLSPSDVIDRLRDPDSPAFRLWYLPRRLRLIVLVRALALWNRSTVDLYLPPDLIIGRRVKVTIARRSNSRLQLGRRSLVGDDVWFQLSGGALVAGDQVQLRSRCVISVGGRIDLVGGNAVSYGTVIHCAEKIYIDRGTGIAEYCGIADSTHFHTDPADPAHLEFHHNTLTAPVHIGREVFLCPRVGVSRGVTIGDFVIVGPNSAVARDLPPGTLASGVPAQVTRSLGYSWVDAAGGR